MHDITYYEYNMMLFKCDIGTGWCRVRLVPQLVMRSFDVADKEEVKKRVGPLVMRGERTAGHCHRTAEDKDWQEAIRSMGHEGFCPSNE